MGARGPSKGSVGQPVTQKRIDLFLAVYRESGANFTAAAAAACPGAKEGNRKPCFSTFVLLKQKDFGFAAALTEILEQVRDDIEAEIDRRGRVGWLDPIVQKGEHVQDADGKPMFIRRFDSKLLLARAKALMPDRYGEKKDINITHHKGSSGGMTIEGSEALQLSREQRANLSDIMVTIGGLRDGVKQIEHKPAPVFDVPVVEVEPVLVEVVAEPAVELETFPPWVED